MQAVTVAFLALDSRLGIVRVALVGFVACACVWALWHCRVRLLCCDLCERRESERGLMC